jgi:hypothetical protein
MMPGVGPDLVAPIRELLIRAPEGRDFLPLGVTINGSLSRDPDNPVRVDILRAGLAMGRITASNKYAPAILGITEVALTSAATTLKTSATTATEIVRRIGATGTLTITGPSAAGGTVRSLTATYSAVGTGAAVNEIQICTPTGVGSAGTFIIQIRLPSGAWASTTALAYSATGATIQTAIDVALGVANGAVGALVGGGSWTATTPLTTPTAFQLTFSGTGYAGLPQPAFRVLSSVTGNTAVPVVRSTLGVPAVGNITISALGINDVQQVNFPIASTAGNVVIEFTLASGVRTRTAPIAWNATDATYLASINSALDTATGVGSAIVATAISATDTDLGFVLTFSGTGYAALPQPLVAITTFPTSSTSYSVTHTTTGQAGAMVVGSLIQPTDGSQNIVTLYGNKYGQSTLNALLQSIDIQYPDLLVQGMVWSAMIINYPQDASLKAWLKASLRANGGVWMFDDDFISS